MAIGGVGLALDQVGPVQQPFFARRGDKRARQWICKPRPSRIRGEVFVAADAFAGHPRIEKERPPANFHRHIRHQRQRVLDPPLPI